MPEGGTGERVLNPDVLEDLYQVERDGAEGLVAELFAIFQREGGRRIEVLNVARSGGGEEMLRREAHALKGSGAGIGAERLAAVCARLEATGDGTLVEQIAREFERAVDALQAVIAARNS